MTASLFGVGGTVNVNVNGTLVPQSYVATPGQTSFLISNFIYTINTNSLLVWINGVKQISGTDFTEVDSIHFTLVEACIGGERVEIIGFPEINLTAVPVGSIVFQEPLTNSLPISLNTELLVNAPAPESFGAIGDGVTIDRGAFTLALAAAAISVSKTLKLSRGKIYNLGNITSSADIFFISGINGIIIDFNGAKIICNTFGGDFNAGLFSLNNLDQFTLKDPWVEDTGFDQTRVFKGITVVRLHPTTGILTGVNVYNAKYKGVVAGFDTDTAAFRAKKIHFSGHIENCLYGINLANNGDQVIAAYTTYNAVRSYFCYGINSHDIICFSENHAAIGNADFLIKVKDPAFPTRGIKAHFESINSQSNTNPQLVFESQNDAGTTEIDDCDIFFSDRQSVGLSYSIAFRHYNNASVLQAADPNIKRNIRIRGFAQAPIMMSNAAYPGQSSTPATLQEIYLADIINCAFCASKSAISTNQTGNAGVVSLIFDTETLDRHNDYVAGTGIFTAPVDGLYSFAVQVLLTAKTNAMTRSDIKIVTPTKIYISTETNTNVSFPEQALKLICNNVPMRQGETAIVQVIVSNGVGNTASVYGDNVLLATRWEGSLVK